MSTSRLIAVNGSAGAFVDILSSIPARSITVREDDAGTGAQGLDYKWILDNFANTYDVKVPISADPQLVLPSEYSVASLRGRGSVIGYPAMTPGGNSIPATKLLSLRSKTATATAVRIVENE